MKCCDYQVYHLGISDDMLPPVGMAYRSCVVYRPDLGMNLKQLHYFVRIAELGSISRAAVDLHIAQPALSRQIRRLEIELQQTLLIRTGRGVRVTDAGKVLAEHGRGILHQVERARADLSRVKAGLVGRVALGLPPGLANTLTAPLVRAFYESSPDATLSISEGLSILVQGSLILGDLDVVLLYNAVPSPDIELTPLLDQNLYHVSARAGKANAKSTPLAQLAEKRLVIPRRPNAIRMQLETQLATIGCRPRIALEVDTIPGLLDLVAEGIGDAVLPKISIDAFGRNVDFCLAPVVAPKLTVKLYSAVSARRPTTPTQQHLVRLVRESVVKLVK